jgi:phosphotransferase system enzyme I (PtsI)
MGVESLSVGPAALAEIKKLIRSVSRTRAEAAVADVLAASSADEIVAILMEHIRNDVDLSRFAGSWSLSHAG